MSTHTALDPAELLREAPTLGSPPAVYRRLVEVLDDPRAGTHEVAAVVGQDPALTARLLRLANSVYFSFNGTVASVHQAVSLIGATHVRDIALATSVTDFFPDVPPDLVNLEEFWRHSLAVGIGARTIAELRREANLERFFVAGMLHDVGRLVLYVCAPDHARAILEHAKRTDCLVYDAELEVGGVDHGAIGGMLLAKWNMPESLVECVALHHRPAAAGEHPVEAATVHLADLVANALGLGRSGERGVPPRWIGVWDALALDPAELPDLMTSVQEQYAQVVSIFGLSGG